MSVLTDRQRIEFAIPPYLFFALTSAPGVFVPAEPGLAKRAEAEIGSLREDLRTAALEPFSDLPPAKRSALLRRLERIKRQVVKEWPDYPALTLMSCLWRFLEELINRKTLILWEGSAMDRAMQRLTPMYERGCQESNDIAASGDHAFTLLDRLQAEGLYR